MSDCTSLERKTQPHAFLAKARRSMRGATLLLVAMASAQGCRGKSNGTVEASATPSSQSGSVTPYKSPNGIYEAKFFGEPSVEKNEELQPAGVTLVTTSVTEASEARLFMINELALSKIVQYDCKVGLSGMIKKSLERMGCTSEDDQPIALAGRPGRDVRFTCDKRPARGRMRVYCDVRDLATGHVTAYSVMALYQNELWNPPEASVFLDSFILH